MGKAHWPGRPRSRLRTVRLRITALAVVLVGVGLGLGAWVLVERVQARLEDEVVAEGKERILFVQQTLDAGAPPEEAIAGVASVGTYTQVLDSDGRVLASSSADVSGESASAPAPDVAPLPDGEGDFVYTVTNGPQGPLTIITRTPLEEVRRSVTALSQALWVAIPLAVLVVGGLAWFLTGRALRPVDRIRNEVDEISHTTLHRRVPDPGTADEVGRLARTMNAMLDRLERAQDQQRRFVSDASHELRSPLTTIRASVEVAARHRGQERWEQAGATVLAETERLDGLVGDLLELARLDENQGTGGERATIDLDEIVGAEVARLNGAGRVVDTTDVGAVRVLGDRSQLTRLVRNLLDNAQRHAKGRVAVTVRAERDEAVLWVDDDGPGVPDADRERVFERFTRLDEGRARSAGGAGLGLALVRAVATAHGGSAVVTDAPTGGARFAVRLPVLRRPTDL